MQIRLEWYCNFRNEKITSFLLKTVIDMYKEGTLANEAFDSYNILAEINAEISSASLVY